MTLNLIDGPPKGLHWPYNTRSTKKQKAVEITGYVCWCCEPSQEHNSNFVSFMKKYDLQPMGQRAEFLATKRHSDYLALLEQAGSLVRSNESYYNHIVACKKRMSELERNIQTHRRLTLGKKGADLNLALLTFRSVTRTIYDEANRHANCIAVYRSRMKVALQCAIPTNVPSAQVLDILDWIEHNSYSLWHQRASRLTFVLMESNELFSDLNLLPNVCSGRPDLAQQLDEVRDQPKCITFIRVRLHAHGCIALTVLFKDSTLHKYLAQVRSWFQIVPISNMPDLVFALQVPQCTTESSDPEDFVTKPRPTDDAPSTRAKHLFTSVTMWAVHVVQSSLFDDTLRMLDDLSIVADTAAEELVVQQAEMVE